MAGGVESMSNAPHYLNLRKANRYGNSATIDGLITDGLTDVYSQQSMGVLADNCSTEYGISRKSQDNYAISSYNRSINSSKNGLFKNEIIPSDSHFEIREKSSGDNFHVVVPNYTLSYSINYLCRQAQGTDAESGLQDSFFFFQTANGNFRLQSLDSMLKIKYAGNRPFAYTETREDNPKDIPADKTDEGLVGIGRKILSYNIGTSADVLKGITQGLFASKQTTIDTTFKYFSERSYNFLEKFYAGKDSAIDIYPFVRTAPESIYKGGSAGEGQDVPILGAKTLDSIGSYTDANILLKSDTQFVHNEENKIVQVGYDAAQGSDQFRQAAKQLLEYHTVSAVLSARTDISVGQIINLQIPVSSQGEDNIDPFFYNGDHLITEIMWKLTPSDCETHIKCIKDSVINHIETTQVEYGKSI